MSRIAERHLNLNHPLTGGQRALDDVLVRINYRDDRKPVIQYASRGRADMMLARYSRETFASNPKQPVWVERLAVTP